MHDLTGFQRDLLFIIAGIETEDEGPHGLAIKSRMGDYYEEEINHGRLYPNLDALIEKGLVSKSKKDERTNEYKVTMRGAREIEERREWEDGMTRNLAKA
jgi:DNA-binding PadR family transcriptional regulator